MNPISNIPTTTVQQTTNTTIIQNQGLTQGLSQGLNQGYNQTAPLSMHDQYARESMIRGIAPLGVNSTVTQPLNTPSTDIHHHGPGEAHQQMTFGHGHHAVDPTQEHHIIGERR